MNEIENLRKELASIIKDTVKPMRAKLDHLLNEEAKKLCPFNEGEIITLDNGKLGQITTIEYLSLDYDFQLKDSDFYQEHFGVVEYAIEDIYAYNIDDKPFSITWKISGLRMIQKGKKVGKVPFHGISPKDYIIDVVRKSVNRKELPDFVDNLDFLSDFKDFSDNGN